MPLYDYMKFYNASGVSIMWKKDSKTWNEDQYYTNDWILQVCSGYSMNAANREKPWHKFNGYISKKNTNNNNCSTEQSVKNMFFLKEDSSANNSNDTTTLFD